MGATPSKDNEQIEKKEKTICECELRQRCGTLQKNPNLRNDKEDSEEKTPKVYIELHKFVVILMAVVAALIGSVVGAQNGVSGSCKGIICGVLVGIILSKLISLIHGNI